MKKILFSIFLLGGSMCNAQITDPAPYCNSTYGLNSSSPVISKVALGSFTNNSAGHCSSPGYIYYNNLGAISLAQGSSQTIKVTYGDYDMETMLKAWIDYNNNTAFEPDEEIINIAQGTMGGGSNLVQQATFTVPVNATAGTIRMRVSIGWHFADWTNNVFSLESCHTAVANEYSAGETEDYDVTIINTVGIHETSNNSFVNVYPNPFSTSVTISINTQDIRYKTAFIVYDLLGQEVLQSAITDPRFEIQRGDLQSGMYFYKLITASEVTGIGKLIVK